jgi:predicted membrane channel-forming protein YqfA (hemolysin III family)
MNLELQHLLLSLFILLVLVLGVGLTGTAPSDWTRFQKASRYFLSASYIAMGLSLLATLISLTEEDNDKLQPWD